MTREQAYKNDSFEDKIVHVFVANGKALFRHTNREVVEAFRSGYMKGYKNSSGTFIVEVKVPVNRWGERYVLN